MPDSNNMPQTELKTTKEIQMHQQQQEMYILVQGINRSIL